VNTHTALILAGVALGAFAGYKYAGWFQTKPVYSQLDGFIRSSGMVGGSPQYQQPTIGQQIDQAGNVIGGVIDVVGNALDTLDRIFGDDYDDVQELYASSGQF
jgi:hypothetical protein